MAFRWRADDGLLMVVFDSYLLSTKKTCKSGTPSDKTFLIRACYYNAIGFSFSGDSSSHFGGFHEVYFWKSLCCVAALKVSPHFHLMHLLFQSVQLSIPHICLLTF